MKRFNILSIASVLFAITVMGGGVAGAATLNSKGLVSGG